MEGVSEGEKKKEPVEGENKSKRKMKTASQLEVLEKAYAGQWKKFSHFFCAPLLCVVCLNCDSWCEFMLKWIYLDSNLVMTLMLMNNGRDPTIGKEEREEQAKT